MLGAPEEAGELLPTLVLLRCTGTPSAAWKAAFSLAIVLRSDDLGPQTGQELGFPSKSPDEMHEERAVPSPSLIILNAT